MTNDTIDRLMVWVTQCFSPEKRPEIFQAVLTIANRDGINLSDTPFYKVKQEAEHCGLISPD